MTFIADTLKLEGGYWLVLGTDGCWYRIKWR
jgi:hypothetical protein